MKAVMDLSRKFKRIITPISMIIVSLTTNVSNTSARPEPLQEKLKSPLITGASVSADWNSLSPGKKLALRYTDKQHIKTLAQGGRPGRETIRLINEEKLKDRTIIIGIDLFFWDSTLQDIGPSLSSMDKLVRQVSELDIPLILGEIPELLPGRQPTRSKLNKEINRLCSEYEKCYLMRFDKLHKQIMRDGHLEIKGRNYSLRELVPDGLHLSEVAGNYLADRLAKLLMENSRKL